MTGLTPADLGLLDDDDNAVIGSDPSLPEAALPPRPADLRSKEGREWKKLAKQAGIDTKAERLTGDETRAGRPAGRPRTVKNVDHFKKVLLSSHMKAALVTGVEEIALDDEEAGLLAESIAELLSYYKIKVDGKGGAVLGLLYAVSMVYGSRLLPYLLPNIVGMFKRDDTTPQGQNVVRANFPQ